MLIKTFYLFMYIVEKISNQLITRKIHHLMHYFINFILPLYYSITPTQKPGVNQRTHHSNEPRIIVSLTTFPPRMSRLWVVLETLLRQTYKPDKILLWVATSQFPSLDFIDQRVLKLRERGIEIRFCDDLKSHKKYFYTMKEYPNDLVITVDDDIFYPVDLVENLVSRHNEYPSSIICYRAHLITLKDGKVTKYKNWDYRSKSYLGPDTLLMATNGAGTLYPPNSLSDEAFNIKAIQSLCPNADDIWLKCMGYINGTTTVKVYKDFPEVFTTLGSGETGLALKNVESGENDIQLNKVLEHYQIDFTKG